MSTATSALPARQYSRAELHRRIAPYTQASSLQGYASFGIDVALYALGLLGVLFFEGLLGKIAAGALVGTSLVNLGTLAHEAAHRSMVRSRLGNKIIGVATMTMVLFNYRLWIFDHHVLHHARTNVKGENSFSPLTLSEYREMSWFRRALYRAYRSEWGAGVFLYYLLERWPGVHLYPGAWLPKKFHASAWRYTALQVAYAAALIAILVSVASARNDSIAAVIFCGFVLPYSIWLTIFAMTVCLQHTNPRIRWYREKADTDMSPEALSVQMLVPGWFNHLTHYALEHPVHHVSAMIPHYHLKKAQAALGEIADPSVIAIHFSFGDMRKVLRACKLYDYDQHVWVDFDGKVLAVPDRTLALRKLSATGDDLPPYGGDQLASNGIFFPADQTSASERPVESERREDA